jgi:Tol biopolymer transport system component
MRRVVAVGVALAAVVAGLTMAVATWVGQARATFPGANGLIAFDRNTGQRFTIAVVRPDRSGLQTLIENASAPRWSADGRYIAFQRRTGQGGWAINIANADGSGVRELDDPGSSDLEPAWSPDGTQLVYVGFTKDNPQGDVYIVNADGSGRRQLTQDSHDYNTFPISPAWSPDGRWIAYIREDGVLSLIHPDGSDRHDLGGDGTAAAPSWSPDGTEIAFAASGRGNSSGNYDDIYVMPADDSSAARDLTNTLAPEGDATWSPDGTKIVYTVSSKGTDHGDLYVMNADGSHRRPLVRGQASKYGPDWQPTSSSTARMP